MKRTFAVALAALAAAAVFGALVYAVLVAAHVSRPAVATVSGLTPRRLWATTVALLGLAGAVIGGIAVARPSSRFGADSGRIGAFVSLAAGLVAVVNGALNVAVANGGPGTGNGVVGGAAAFVLGFIALALGGLARARRSPHTSPDRADDVSSAGAMSIQPQPSSRNACCCPTRPVRQFGFDLEPSLLSVPERGLRVQRHDRDSSPLRRQRNNGRGDSHADGRRTGTT